MRDEDVTALLQAEAGSAPSPHGLHRRTVRRARVLRAAFVSTGAAAVLAVAVLTTLALRTSTDERPDFLSPPRETPATEEESNYVWPEVFVPPTSRHGDQAILEVVFMDRTVARLSYPAELRLAEMGVQTTISYAFDDEQTQLGGPFEIIAVNGAVPDGLLGEELQSFDSPPVGRATLHQVTGRGTLRGLGGNPPFALVFSRRGWNFVATVPSRDEAATVAENLHPSVTDDGWPSLSTTGPLQLSRGFGEARGPHLEFNDEDPRWGIHTRDTYVVMGVVSGCGRGDEGVSGGGGDTYAAKCLAFEGGEPGVFVSMYGPEHFVRDLYEGLSLAGT